MKKVHMRRLAIWTVLFVAQAGRALAAQPVAITHVTVVDVASGTNKRDQTVVLEGDRILAAGSASAVTLLTNARRIDGRGKYLIPGMWDMHVHLGMTGRFALAMLVANGVLGVRDMGGNFETVRAWRDSIAVGSLLGPRIEMVGPILENARWLNRVSAMLAQQGNAEAAATLGERIAVSTPEEAREAVARVVALGVSMIKVRNDPGSAAYFELLREARRRQLRVVGHPPERGPSLEQASDSGQASIEHLLLRFRQGTWVSTFDDMSSDARTALFARFARNGTAFVPTIVAGIGFRRMPDSVALALIDDTSGVGDPRRRYVPQALARTWRGQIEMKRLEGAQPDWEALGLKAAANIRALDAAGVPILTGTDLGTPFTYPGFGLHDELALLVREGGLAPARALRAATLGPAQFFGLERELGLVAPGMRANLVLLSADPLADIANVGRVDSVILGGRLFARDALDRLLRDVAAGR